MLEIGRDWLFPRPFGAPFFAACPEAFTMAVPEPVRRLGAAAREGP